MDFTQGNSWPHFRDSSSRKVTKKSRYASKLWKRARRKLPSGRKSKAEAPCEILYPESPFPIIRTYGKSDRLVMGSTPPPGLGFHTVMSWGSPRQAESLGGGK